MLQAAVRDGWDTPGGAVGAVAAILRKGQARPSTRVARSFCPKHPYVMFENR
jgi:hypothetical protein